MVIKKRRTIIHSRQEGGEGESPLLLTQKEVRIRQQNLYNWIKDSGFEIVQKRTLASEYQAGQIVKALVWKLSLTLRRIQKKKHNG